MIKKSTLLLLTLSSITFSTLAIADSTNVIAKFNNNVSATTNYWTPERLKNAKPKVLPQQIPHKIRTITIDSAPSFSTEAAAPTSPMKPDLKKLFEGNNATGDLQMSPNDVGSKNIHFSSSRLVPLTADLSYPYTTVGKLFFSESGGNYVCSASVIANRLVVTAGHCVHSGSGGESGYYTNFLFIPAYRDNAAPFQKWTWTYVVTTPAWMNGGAEVANAGDFALLEMKDNTVKGATKTIGSITGHLGYATNKLASNHLHLLGYPCNFDSCKKMHQVTSSNGPAVAPNNVTYGSDMGGGSSGGPWIQNFGVFADGQLGGLNSHTNQVVAVTSWGYTSASPLVQGAANFDSAFDTIYNTACAHQAGNC